MRTVAFIAANTANQTACSCNERGGVPAASQRDLGGPKPPRGDKIEIEVDGQKYHGHYLVERGRLTVWTVEGHRVRELGLAEPKALAEQLLLEMICKQRRK